MIARLRGRLDSNDEAGVVVEVGGVGYLVFCPRRTCESLPGPGAEVDLLIETHVRDDHIHLYGFASAAERAWFRRLLTVQGVGARVAMAVLSVLSPEQLATAVAAQDAAALRRVGGVGPKVAGRIVAELKDKVVAMAVAPAASAGPVPGSGASGEAVSALVNLGYGRSEAFTAIAAAARRLGADGDVASLIRHGLRELASA
ncbi:MAG TPA: Holliday junction branch migration protein RuvA [Alphaproteobacteria bacterium]